MPPCRSQFATIGWSSLFQQVKSTAARPGVFRSAWGISPWLRWRLSPKPPPSSVPKEARPALRSTTSLARHVCPLPTVPLAFGESGRVSPDPRVCRQSLPASFHAPCWTVRSRASTPGLHPTWDSTSTSFSHARTHATRPAECSQRQRSRRADRPCMHTHRHRSTRSDLTRTCRSSWGEALWTLYAALIRSV